ncbi:hypothetical protein QYE76_069898 [Lolium multiflorum]|uniref:Uncharacterized protein n=1 Tax=Lolium multiflorum TaxID=4521 RepID=A0AAD8SIW7_LOLMU|nr:hypothetical protein QYE76_069898 [Lolium multiflorum]
MLDERKEAAHFMENFHQRELEVDEQLVKVKELQQHWKDKVTELQREADKIRRDAIPPRKITFATPTEQQPLATPKDNMKKAAEILKKKTEEIDIEYVRTLVASAMKQQSKADTSRRLESNPEHCVSTAQKDAYDNRHRDDESRTGSSERRRKTREHPTDTRVLHLLTAVVQSETPGLMVQVESTSAITCRPRETESVRRNPAEAGTTIENPSLGGVGTRSVTRSLAEAGTTKATRTMVKAAIEAGVSTVKDGETRMAEARGHTGPLAGLPHHHLAVEAEVEAEAAAGDPALAQNPPATARVTRGNASTSTKLITLAQSALAG